VRFGERLGVERSIEHGVERCLVPPLLLQPLVENAIKHGVSERIEGGVIVITVRRLGEALVLSIENPVDEPATSRVGEGHGLENVKRRLAALDPRRTHLETSREGGRFRVTLTLPADEAEDAAAPPATAAASMSAPRPSAAGAREGVRPGEARLA
jgi:LytS/YehU family sensor histidine kinase